MRNDSIFYDLIYPDVEEGKDGENPQPTIEFNDNIVLAGIDEIKKIDKPGIYSIKLASKEDPMDIPELSIIAHLDDQQKSVEIYAEMLKLVKEKEVIEPEDCDQCECEPPVEEPQPPTDSPKGDK